MMNAPDKFLLPDVQATPDLRRMAIQHVGVKDIRYPLTILDGSGKPQSTVAKVAMTVGLPPEVKGTHMSRFVEILEAQHEPLAIADMPKLLDSMLQRLEANSGSIEFQFPYFINKTAPVSGVQSLLDYDVTLSVAQVVGAAPQITLQVTAPVTSLCPCSKMISEYGAHNQRSHICIRAELVEVMSVEALVRLAEEESSCEVFGLLKRPDEKWVTERAYDNPKFVEDLVRDIALRLQAESHIAAWRVSSENFESIHNHSAWAVIEGRNVASSVAE